MLEASLESQWFFLLADIFRGAFFHLSNISFPFLRRTNIAETDYTNQTPLIEVPGADMDEETSLLNRRTTSPESKVENI